MKSALAAFVLLVVACGGNEAATTTLTTEAPTTAPSTTLAPATTVAPTTTATTSTTVAPTTTIDPATISPLNGLAVADAALLDRRVLALKIDNHWNARPQSGLHEADAVYELLVEANLTRFIAMFLQSDSEFVGPMRSGRPTDPTLVRPLEATFAISGAQPWISRRIAGAGVRLIGEVKPATSRAGFRRAPHNLYANTALLREYADGRSYADDPPPGPFFAWGPMPSDAQPAVTIDLDFSAATKITWEWDGEAYQRFAQGEPHELRTEEGEILGQITAETLVVLFADKYTAFPPGAGSAVPAMDTVGTGRALVFANGQVVEGSWEREEIEEMFTLTTEDGAEIAVPPGHLWVSIVPTGRTASW